MSAPAAIYIRAYEVPEVFRISRSTLYRWVSAGHIRLYRRGAAAFLNVAEVSAFIEKGQRAAS